MPVRVLTDSEPTLESIASTKQIERKGLRITVQEMKEKLRDGEIYLQSKYGLMGLLRKLKWQKV